MTKIPDTTIDLHPEYCHSCGADLSSTASKEDSIRQTIDIPPIKATYTEYRIYSKPCSCGCGTIADFPKGVNAPVSEGGIHYLLNRFSEKSSATYQNIKKRVASSTVIGTDETGVKVNGNKHWFWTWQTDKLT